MSEDWYEPEGSGVGLDEILAVMDRRKYWFVIAALIGVALGGAALQVLVPSYSARTTILYEPRDLPKEFVRSTLQDSVEQELATLRERITSHDHITGLIARTGRQRLDPNNDYSDNGLIRKIRREVTLDIGNAFSPEAQVFELVYSADDPKLAVDVVQELTGLFIRAESRNRSQQARTTVEFLTDEVAQVTSELAALDQQARDLRQALPSQLLQGQDPTVSAGQSAALETARRRLATARARYTEEHPDVRELRREVARLQSMRRASDIVKPADSANFVLYQQLLRDRERLTANYEELRNKQLNARLSSRLEVANEGRHFQVLSPATIPRKPDFPIPWIVLLGGGVLGLGLSIVVIGSVELLQPTFSSIQAIADATGLQVVASIPKISAGEVALEGDLVGAVDDNLVAVTAPESAPAEQYRSLLPMLIEREGVKTILITSAQRADGKSVTASNLAATIARGLEQNVLLIDADLRRPRAHRLLRKGLRPGLVDVLKGKLELDEAIVSTAITRLSLLPAGWPSSDPTPLLTSGRMRDVVEKAQGRYETIVIDAPPHLPVIDTRILSRVADAVLFVVRADATPRRAVQRSLEELGSAVTGIVFNGVRPSAYKRYYYADAYATYAYGEPRTSTTRKAAGVSPGEEKDSA